MDNNNLSLQKSLQKKNVNKIKNTIVKEYNNHISYYIHNFEDGGWVIISGIKAKGPILGYSCTGSIEEEQIPDVFKVWMKQFDVAIDLAYSKNKQNPLKVRKWNELENAEILKSGTKPTGLFNDYFIKTLWGQGVAPSGNTGNCGYNTLMPVCTDCGTPPCNVNNACERKCLAGCGPLAVAQIVNFWGYSRGYDVNFDWWNMEVPGFTSAIPPLLAFCGKKMNAKYCNGSCATSTDDQWETHWNVFSSLGYSIGPIEKKGILVSYNKWLNMLKDEILAGRPVLYFIRRHVIICDGYNSANGNFHWNFGYNGLCDGWMDFEDMDCDQCDGEGAINEHMALIGIHPEIPENLELASAHVTNKNLTYQANNSIVINSDFHVENSSNLRLVAGNNITLKGGFKVDAGCRFETKIYKKYK